MKSNEQLQQPKQYQFNVITLKVVQRKLWRRLQITVQVETGREVRDL
jgi:hypothetical protein